MPSSELDYKRYLNLFKKKKKLFFATALSIMTVAVLMSYLLPKKYEAKSTVFIEKNAIGELAKGIAVSPSSDDDSLKVMYYALTSRTLLTKVINNVDFNLKSAGDAEIQQLLDYIQKNIDIDINGKDPNMFTVSFKYSDPRVARDFVNTLVQMFIEENVSAKRQESSGANQFLSEEITTYKDRLDKAQAAINAFKTKQGAVANIDGDSLMRDIESSKQRLADLEARKSQLEEEKTYAKNATDPLRVKLTALTQRLGELRSQFTDSFPEIIDLKAQIKSLQQEINSGKKGSPDVLTPQELWKIDTELKSIAENEKILESYIAKDQQLLDSIPNTKSALNKLEAEKTNEQNMYDLLFLRQNQSEISKQMQDKSVTFQVVDPAVTPIYPVSPNREKIILLGIFAGLAAGCVLLMALDYIDNSVKTVDSLKEFGVPVLAVIPLIKSEEEIRGEKRRDMRVYLLSGAYFSVILVIMVMEVLGIKLMDTVMGRVHLPLAAVRFLDRF